MITLENVEISRRRLDHDRYGRHQRTYQSLGILDQRPKNESSSDLDHLVRLRSVKLALTLLRHHASENE